MEKSVVYVSMKDDNNLDCNYSIIEKGEKSVIIINKDLENVIYDYNDFIKEDFNYKYLLLKHYDNSSLAYKDLMKLIGKMCKKNVDSKYFNNHIDEDNRIIFINDMDEHMILKSEKNNYSERLNSLNNFIKLNRSKLRK